MLAHKLATCLCRGETGFYLCHDEDPVRLLLWTIQAAVAKQGQDRNQDDLPAQAQFPFVDCASL